jgi:hypothetical protein
MIIQPRQIRAERTISPPSGYEGYLSRRAAAALLGFGSEFKIRQLEKAGRLRPVRGAMGSAWYPRAQVVALRQAAEAGGASAPAGRWSDAALITHLRARARSVVDLVADTGISITRAERVYRFWLAHDAHPVAGEVRAVKARAAALERRNPERLERDDLIRQLRDPNPRARAAAFEKLKPKREPPSSG